MWHIVWHIVWHVDVICDGLCDGLCYLMDYLMVKIISQLCLPIDTKSDPMEVVSVPTKVQKAIL